MRSTAPSTSPRTHWRASAGRGQGGFSLIELLTAAVVFVIIGMIMAQLLASATSVTGTSNKKQEADVQARLVFGRMALDFSRMLKRADVEYFLKKNVGNDQIAFLSEVTGYYPSTASPGTVSVVAYRIRGGTAELKGLERMSAGLSWFSDGSGESPVAYHKDIASIYPEATGMNEYAQYEEIGQGVFRFEVFYLLKSGKLSEEPWDVGAGHTKTDGLRDVAAICVALAVIDPSVRTRVTTAEVRSLAATMNDFTPGTMSTMGDLDRQWQGAVNQSEVAKKIGGSVRILTRSFPIKS